MNPKYPEIEAQFSLSGPDGNAFAIIGRVASLLRKAGYSDEVSAFQKEAMAGDYEALKACVGRWISVEFYE